MMNVNRYAVLFEPVQIGPLIARNRFYQVPHCSGLGHLRPQAEAAMRAMKAEGGWAVVANQETEIHPSSDLSPASEHRLWDERDIPALRLMTDAVREKGALSAIELVHNGNHSPNLLTRAPVLAPSDMSIDSLYPKQARAMDKEDIREFRRWHRSAAQRAVDAGFDIIYVYAGHRMTLTQHFLLPEYNNRTDEYGGSLENRARLIRELLEDTREVVEGHCAVAMRFAVEEKRGKHGMQAQEEGRAVVEMLAELPDIWDVNISDWSNDSATTRFEPDDGYQNEYIKFVKDVTTKPVVAVGRLTSPDMMVAMVEKGIVDFIGAARPSIADPFLPSKIAEGRIDEIRECIGCNICVSSDSLGIPIRCTQNPTMGEEWRRGWHPEKIEPKGSEEEALVIGAGPAGLECTMQLAKRGYKVTLAEGSDELGGRALRESRLLGLNAWQRVADNRIYDLKQRANVQLFLESRLDANQVAELDIANVFIATGARWRKDGVGRSARKPLIPAPDMILLTPDDIMSGIFPDNGPVLIYDDDQSYIGGVIAEHLAARNLEIIFVTPAGVVSPWTTHTLEQARVHASLIEHGVDIRTSHMLSKAGAGECEVTCVYSGRQKTIKCRSVVLVTERQRNNSLHNTLLAMRHSGELPGVKTLELIGDAAAPGLIADAVYDGHMAARNFEMDPAHAASQIYRREIPSLELI